MRSYCSSLGGGDGATDQSSTPVVTAASVLVSSSTFRETLWARFGTMSGRSVRWIVAELPRRAAKERPTSPVPAPSSSARSVLSDLGVVDDEGTSAGATSRSV